MFCRGTSGFGVSGCEVVILLPALCLACFVGWPSSSPPNGRLVLLLVVWALVAVWGWFCLFGLRWAGTDGPARCGVWFAPVVRRTVVVRGPPHGAARYVGALPHSWWPAAWCGARRMVEHGPPHGGACCVGAWPPTWWAVAWWCLAPYMLGREVLVPGPPHGGDCRVGAWPLAWWGMVSLMVGPALALVGPPLGGACCVGAWDPSWWGASCSCWTPLMVKPAVVMPGPPHGGACCVGA